MLLSLKNNETGSTEAEKLIGGKTEVLRRSWKEVFYLFLFARRVFFFVFSVSYVSECIMVGFARFHGDTCPGRRTLHIASGNAGVTERSSFR